MIQRANSIYNAYDCFCNIISSASAKFIESIDVSVNLNINSRKSEERVRGVVTFPKGIGKLPKIAVFAHDEVLLKTEEERVDFLGGVDLIEEVKSNKRLNVDWCIATPDIMPLIAPIAKILGSKDLMPNPKYGTVTSDIIKEVKSIKSGKVKFKSEKNGIVHGKLGTIKFDIDDLLVNLKAFLKAIVASKPSSVKGAFIKSVFLSSTMGKAYKIDKVESII